MTSQPDPINLPAPVTETVRRINPAAWPAPAPAARIPGPPANLWQSYTGETPDVYADMFRAAAQTIDMAGHDPHEETGISLSTALARTARFRAAAELDEGRAVFGDEQYERHVDAATDMWMRELEIRLGAVLYMTGQQLHDHGTHLTEFYRDWEMAWTSDAPRPDKARVVAVLGTAAALCELLEDVAEGSRRKQNDALKAAIRPQDGR
jgi:hypothetical protein